MSKKTIFPRIDIGAQAFSDEAIAQRQRVLKERDLRLTKRFVPNIARFKGVPFLPSFLLRTLNDSLHVPSRNLSSLQRAFLTAWTRSGLGKRNAIQQMEKFHKTSKEVFPLLDRRYFELGADKLDGLFVQDIRETDWTPYLDSKSVSASRLGKALKGNTTSVLNATEKLLLTSACDLPPNQHVAALKEFQRRGLGRYIGVQPPPPPPGTVDIYSFSGRTMRWRLLTSSDHISGNADPVFVIQTFYYSAGFADMPAGLHSAGSLVLRPGDDVSASQNWTNYDNWAALLAQAATLPLIGAAFADLLVPPDIVDDTPTVCSGANPTVIVNAFEDDDWISDETENYIDFATDVATQVAALIGGPVATVMSVVDVAWDLVRALDSLDENDRFTPQMWALPESQITNQPVSEFLKIFDLNEIDGTNQWQIEVKLTVTGPIFLA